MSFFNKIYHIMHNDLFKYKIKASKYLLRMSLRECADSDND